MKQAAGCSAAWHCTSGFDDRHDLISFGCDLDEPRLLQVEPKLVLSGIGEFPDRQLFRTSLGLETNRREIGDEALNLSLIAPPPGGWAIPTPAVASQKV